MLKMLKRISYLNLQRTDDSQSILRHCCFSTTLYNFVLHHKLQNTNPKDHIDRQIVCTVQSSCNDAYDLIISFSSKVVNKLVLENTTNTNGIVQYKRTHRGQNILLYNCALGHYVIGIYVVELVLGLWRKHSYKTKLYYAKPCSIQFLLNAIQKTHGVGCSKFCNFIIKWSRRKL